MPESSPERYTKQTRNGGPGERRSPDKQRLGVSQDQKGIKGGDQEGGPAGTSSLRDTGGDGKELAFYSKRSRSRCRLVS